MDYRPYLTDLSDAEWALLEPLLGSPPRRGFGDRHPPADRRRVIDGIRYLLRTGCQWRLVPHEFPPWKTVYRYHRRWCADGTWERVEQALVRKARLAAGRDPTPSAAIIDSQSVKTGEKKGIPAATTRARK